MDRSGGRAAVVGNAETQCLLTAAQHGCFQTLWRNHQQRQQLPHRDRYHNIQSDALVSGETQGDALAAMEARSARQCDARLQGLSRVERRSWQRDLHPEHRRRIHGR